LAASLVLWYEGLMKAFLGEVDHFGLRRLVREDTVLRQLLGDSTGPNPREPRTVVRVLLNDRDAEAIRAQVVAGHFELACDELLSRGIDLNTLGSVVSRSAPQT
jgi:hypothetical protein